MVPKYTVICAFIHEIRMYVDTTKENTVNTYPSDQIRQNLSKSILIVDLIFLSVVVCFRNSESHDSCH